MGRYRLRGAVRPDRIEEYGVRHREVWPELLRALVEAGWRDCALFLRPDGLLAGFVEADDPASARRAIAATEADQRWQDRMSELFVDLGGQPPDARRTVLEPGLDLDGQSPAPVDLRVGDHLAAPVPGRAIPVAGTPRPRLSWVVPAVRQAQRQTAYRIVAAPAGGDPRTGPTVWDSGRVESDRSLHLGWGGAPLPAHEAFSWAVRVWDEHDRPSAWSEPVPLVTGPFDAGDWQASWIEVPATHAARTEFALSGVVTRAQLNLAGQGLARVYLNGQPINADASDPSRTALTRAASRSYDVTHLLTRHQARHALAVAAGLGHYHRVLALPRLLAELVVTFADGRETRIGTGPAWRHGPTSLVHDEQFYLEEHDSRRIDGWAVAGFDDTGWAPAAEPVGGPALPEVEPDAGPPVTVVDELTATRPSGPDAGVAVFDLGRNIAGRSRVVLRGVRPGCRVEIVHGEKLDRRGRVDTLNIRLPDDRDRERQVVAWTCAGTSQIVEPWFAVHGFRYVEVRGLPEGATAEVTARVLHSAVARAGRLTTDDPLLDRLVEMAARTQLNNTHAHPEDCPTREQGGWTGDAAVSAEAALSHLDLAGVYRHWLADLAADQRADGAILGVSPNLLGAQAQPADPVWGSAFTEIPLRHWRHVGDPSLIARQLPAMRRWCDWQLGTLVDGVVRRADISYGADWLAPERTPPVMLQSVAVLRSLRALTQLEAVAGDLGEADRRSAQAERLADTVRARLHDPVTANWANGSQASLALALNEGLATDPEEIAALRDALRAAVRADGDRVASGFAGTGAVVRALADADGGTALLAMVHQPRQPGIGSMLAEGPGTFWETWWIDDDNAGVASLDHIGLAAPFAAWVWTHVAGLRPLDDGYRRFAVAPRLAGPIARATASVHTGRGPIELDWRLDRGTSTLDLTLTVPVGANAELTLPVEPNATITVDGLAAEAHPHVSAQAATLTVPAGHYRFTAGPVVETTAAGALGSIPDMAPGTSSHSAVILPSGGAAVRATDGWRAEIVNGAEGPRVEVFAPAEAATGSTGSVVLTAPDGRPISRRTVRAGRRGQWLSDGAGADGWLPAGPSTTVTPVEGTFRCSPVFHAPVPGPILVVGGEPVAPETMRWARIAFGEPLDLGEARFAFADLDLCFPHLPGRVIEPVLRLVAEDGSRIEDTVRPLPVCWNRIGVDLAGWPGRRRLAAVAVGVRWLDRPDPARGPCLEPAPQVSPLEFRLGRVGWTSAPRTW